MWSFQWPVEVWNYELDYVDLHDVVNFVQQDLHCEVACIVGHSQGSAASFDMHMKIQMQICGMRTIKIF